MQSAINRVLTVLILSTGMTLQVSAQGSAPEKEPVPEVEVESAGRAGHTLEIGIAASGDLIMNSASFTTFPGMVSCQGDSVLFDGSADLAYSVGARLALMPVGSNSIGGDLTLGIRAQRASFEADERIGQTLLPGDQVVPVITRYSLEASVLSLALDPRLLFRPGGSDLLLTAGPSLEFPLSSDMEQRESLVEPSESQFADGRRERNVNGGSIESLASVMFGIGLGISYDIPVADALSIRPFLDGYLGFSSPVTDTDWTPHAIRLGLAVMFRPATEQSNPLTPN